MIVLAAGLLGLVVGSFLNVVIYRVPLRRSVAWPASHCPVCGEPIKPKDNIPLLSYLLLQVIPGMTYKKAARIMWEAHTRGKAVVKSCHKELAELYKERLLGEGLTVSIESTG